MKPVTTCKILHISDLHFGRNFQLANWQDLFTCALNTEPDMVIITGDVVNSPWRHRLRQSRIAIDTLKKDLSASKRNVEVVYVPGNHDTRFFGLIPLQFITATATALLAIWALFSLWQFVHVERSISAGTGWHIGFAVLSGSLYLLRLLMTSQLEKIYDGYYLKKSKRFESLGIGILAFDSASMPKMGAHGRFPHDGLAIIREARTPIKGSDRGATEPDDLFWIAAVHHHVLPLPYDSQHEFTMVMENAGTMLHELATMGVPLILHGHKHHQHFTRAVIRTKDHVEHDISVLSAGTPTEKHSAGEFAHSFNLISIDANFNANVVVYTAATGGEFDPGAPVPLTSPEVIAARSLERNSRDSELVCRKMSASTIIDEYGNVRFIKEFSGLHARAALKSLADVFPCRCTCGEVVDAFAASTGTSLPRIIGRSLYVSEHHATCHIEFTETLEEGDSGAAFYVGFELSNAIALDSRQFKNMHPGKESDTEYISHIMPTKIAVDELLLELRFPTLFNVPDTLTLSVSNGKTGDSLAWTALPRASFDVVGTSSAVFAKIKSPAPGGAYRFSWAVAATTNKVSEYEAILAARLHGRQSDLAEFLILLQNLVIDLLVKDKSSMSPAEILDQVSAVVYCYKRDSGRLVSIAASGNDVNRLGKDEHRYGLGLAGQAFKTGNITVYDGGAPKTISERNYRTHQHTGGHADRNQIRSVAGRVASDTVEACSGIAIPMFPTDSEGRMIQAGDPFSVVQISFGNIGKNVKLTDTDDDHSTTTLQESLCVILCELAKAAKK